MLVRHPDFNDCSTTGLTHKRQELLAVLVIIVPIFDATRQKVIGTIDIESELRDAFSDEVQALLERCADVIPTMWS